LFFKEAKAWRDPVTSIATRLPLLGLIALFATMLNNRPQPVLTGGFNVIDGDSLSRGDSRFRLSGIDAPEYRQQCDRGGIPWPCGQEARTLLVKLLQVGSVECRGDERDRYDRLLVTCQANGININAEMVRRGMAVSFGSYRGEEAAARSAKAGMWAGNFERPQDYRQGGEEQPHGPTPLAAAADFFMGLLGWDQ
jgi:endonuclease YncB( thermonuclease family)